MQNLYLRFLLLFLFALAVAVPAKSRPTQIPVNRVVSQPDSLNYLGFEFSQGKLFVLADLVNSYKRNYLLVMDEKGKCLSSAQLPGNYTGIYLSCDQNVFVGDKDSVLQVYFKNDSIFFSRPFDLGKLLVTIQECLLMADGVVFKQKESPGNIRSLLYAYYKDEHDKNVESLVFEVSDSLALERYEIISGQKNRSARVYMPKQRPRSETKASKNYREQKVRNPNMFRNWPVEQKRAAGFHVPVDMLVNYHNENFYVLDYTNGCIAIINRSLSERRVVDLQRYNRETDLHDFTCDPVTGDFYCFEGMDDTNPLRQYNHQTGQLTYSKRLPNLRDAMNVRVYNQQLYYLVKPDKNKSSKTLMVVDLF